jgi:hypothetical protein
VVEYSPPQNVFVEVLADLVLQRYANPVAAQENMARFKDLVEVRAGVIEQKV